MEQAQVVVRHECYVLVLGCQLKSFSKLLLCFTCLVQAQVGAGEIDVGERMIRPQTYGRKNRVRRLSVLVLRQKGDTERIVSLSEIGFEPHGLSQHLLGLPGLALRLINLPQENVRFWQL